MVVGTVGEGRHAATGSAFGLDADTEEQEPDDPESFLLREMVKWLATGERLSSPP